MASTSVSAPAKANMDDVSINKLFDVNGFKAVVTGGGTGIGLMITQALAANGATVYITGRREDALEKVANEYGQGIKGKIVPMPTDITSKSELEKLVSSIKDKEPNGIQLLVNNAGIARDDKTKFSNAGEPDLKDAQAIYNHFWKSEPEDWAETFGTNVTAHFFTSIAFLPLLAKGTEILKGYSSSVVNVTSISGFMKGSSSGQPAYAASKAAANHLTRMLATTFKDTKVRVNAIAPGIFPSEMTAGESDEKNKSKLEGIGESMPAGRTGSDTDMAASILFLASPAGVFYNNQFIHPDGGNLLVQPAAI